MKETISKMIDKIKDLERSLAISKIKLEKVKLIKIIFNRMTS